jgi:hypothetical protein
MQDRLDGGISLLIRCPGSQATDTLSAEHVAVDLYITPRELQEVPLRIGGDVSMLVQAFCEEFAVPHLHRFMERCHVEGIQPPNHCQSTHTTFHLTVLILFVRRSCSSSESNAVSTLTRTSHSNWFTHSMLCSASKGFHPRLQDSLIHWQIEG